MRIGEMVSNMMMVQNNQNVFAGRLSKANMQLATGKRVNSASDDPSMIGRIERTKAQLNETRITQSSLADGVNRNQTMEATLNSLSSATEELSSLAVTKGTPGADTATIDSQGKELLDSMVSAMASSEFNGANPFSQGTVNYRVSGGSTLSQDTPKFNIVKNATDPTKYDITLNDGTSLAGQSVTDIMDSNYIKTNLTNQVSGAKSSIGTSSNILEFRKNYEATKETVLTKTLSNIEDADLGKATIEANIASQMIQMNQNSLTMYSRMMQSQVGSLFDVRI